MDTVDELYDYKNLGVLKNYIGSFSSNIDDNVEKTHNKAGMIFSSHLDRRKVNPLIYSKFCQSWFLSFMFLVLSLVLSYYSVASKIAIKKLLFLGHLITETKIAPTVRNLFQCRVESYFDTNLTSAGVLLSISESSVKYNPFHHFESWYNRSTFPSYENWKKNCQR